MDLQLRATDQIYAKRGNFGAEVRDGVLLLPKDVKRTAFVCNASTALEFLSQATCFPSAISNLLGWEFGESKAAITQLREQLRKTFDDETNQVLDEAPPQFGMFALPPQDSPEDLRPPDSWYGK